MPYGPKGDVCQLPVPHLGRQHQDTGQERQPSTQGAQELRAGKDSSPQAPLSHRRTALLTGPLHPETLRAPRERPQGYQGLYPTPSRGANAPSPSDLRGLTDALSAAPGYPQGPWLTGMSHWWGGGRGAEGVYKSVSAGKSYLQQSHCLPSSPGAGRNTQHRSGVCESGGSGVSPSTTTNTHQQHCLRTHPRTSEFRGSLRIHLG